MAHKVCRFRLFSVKMAARRASEERGINVAGVPFFGGLERQPYVPIPVPACSRSAPPLRSARPCTARTTSHRLGAHPTAAGRGIGEEGALRAEGSPLFSTRRRARDQPGTGKRRRAHGAPYTLRNRDASERGPAR